MTIRDQIGQVVKNALEEAQRRELLPPASVDDPSIERPQDRQRADFACSLPLKLARPMRMNPMSIAEVFVSLIPSEGALEKVWAAPPGFINFSLNGSWLAKQVDAIRQAGASYGDVGIGEGRRVQIDFVSVNPNGPIHVGHIRGAVLGSALANVLEAAGYEVEREYFLNDGGTQMDLFNRSLYARYQQAHGKEADIPPDGYQGEYMVDLARDIQEQEGSRFHIYARGAGRRRAW